MVIRMLAACLLSAAVISLPAVSPAAELIEGTVKSVNFKANGTVAGVDTVVKSKGRKFKVNKNKVQGDPGFSMLAVDMDGYWSTEINVNVNDLFYLVLTGDVAYVTGNKNAGDTGGYGVIILDDGGVTFDPGPTTDPADDVYGGTGSVIMFDTAANLKLILKPDVKTGNDKGVCKLKLSPSGAYVVPVVDGVPDTANSDPVNIMVKLPAIQVVGMQVDDPAPPEPEPEPEPAPEPSPEPDTAQ